MLKVLKYLFFGWLILSVITLPFYGPLLRMIWVFNPVVSAPKYETPSTQAEARLQDIDYLKSLTRYDRSFSTTAKAAFLDRLEAITENVANMSDAQFYLALAEAVALADNGHTNISYRPQYTAFNTIGARLYTFSDGVFILSTAPQKIDTLGRRVLSVNGTPIEDLRSALGKYRGGSKEWRDLYSTLIVESPELLAAANFSETSDAIELGIETSDGGTEMVQFDGIVPDSMDELPRRSAWQTMIPDGGSPGFSNWPHILETDGAVIPKYLSVPSEPLYHKLDDNGFYIRALAGLSSGDWPIKSMYKSILSDLPEGSLDYLVVDFRLHDGGDYMQSIAFAKAAPKAVKKDGEIYVVTGPNTFSAAIVTVAMLKHYSEGRGIIIGEKIGDREQFWAERGTSFQLPNSGYYINYATGYHDWEKGCKGEPYCFTLNERHEVPAGSLAPEVSIPQDFESYRRGEDVVMNWIDQQR